MVHQRNVAVVCILEVAARAINLLGGRKVAVGCGCWGSQVLGVVGVGTRSRYAAAGDGRVVACRH